MVVVVRSWWRQRGKTGVALRAILMRRVPLGALARLVLPAVLTRPVAPLLARATVVPASASVAVAPVVALGASTVASFPYGSEILAVAGVMGVQVVEGAEWTAALGRLGVVLKGICPRGNNKVLFISFSHDKCLLFMLELY